jgi:predicted Zn-dependent protease
MMLGALSAAYYMQGDAARAREAALLGIDKSPSFPLNYRSLANACGLLGLQEEGRAALDHFLALAPHYTDELGRRTKPFANPEDFTRYTEGLRRLGWRGG